MQSPCISLLGFCSKLPDAPFVTDFGPQFLHDVIHKIRFQHTLLCLSLLLKGLDLGKKGTVIIWRFLMPKGELMP